MPQILILDNSRDIISVLFIILESAGYEVMATTNELEALRLLRTEPIDLFIQNLLRPEASGDERVRHFRDQESLRNIPSFFSPAAERNMPPKTWNVSALTLINISMHLSPSRSMPGSY